MKLPLPLPACAACRCPAGDHALITDVTPDTFTATVTYGSCASCDCTGYRIEVPNPRMSARVEGFPA